MGTTLKSYLVSYRVVPDRRREQTPFLLGALRHRLEASAMILQHFFNDRNAFSAFRPASAGGVNVRRALARIRSNGFIEAAIGKRVANADIHRRIPWLTQS
jgi:hypothetical protein